MLNILGSLCTKRFRGIGEQRKTERNGIVGVLSAQKLVREPKEERGGGGRERRKCLQTTPSSLKTVHLTFYV